MSGTTTQSVRLERLAELVERWYADAPNTTGAEDLPPYLSGQQSIPRWAVVTSTMDHAYVVPVGSKAEATRYVDKVIVDDIYPEAPRLLMNLEDGRTFSPVVTTEWEPTP